MENTNHPLHQLVLARNPLLRIRLSRPLVVDVLLEQTSYEISNSDIFVVLTLANDKTPFPLLSRQLSDRLGIKLADAQAVITSLYECNFLVDESYKRQAVKAATHWEQRGWLDALLFHLRSRNLDYQDVVGCSPPAAAEVPGEIGPVWETYDPGAVRVPLPAARPLPTDRSLKEVLLSRRTGGPWRHGCVQADVLSSILLHANQESHANRAATELRGATEKLVWLRHSSYCALETAVFVFDVEGIVSGIYDYDVRDHQLVLKKAGLFRTELGKLCIGQMHAGQGAAAFVVSAVWARYMKRYSHARAYRNLFINTAELVHKYIIAATAFGLSNFITPAIDDELAADLLGVESFEQAPLYMAAVG